jgi:hypothetical protein
MKVFQDNQKLKQYMTTKPPIQKILQRILHTENEGKQNHERSGSTKPQEKKSKKVESNIDLAAHNQTLKQQRQLNDRNHHITINSNMNVNGLNSLIKRHLLTNCIKRKDTTTCCLQETHLIDRKKTQAYGGVLEDLPSQWLPKTGRSSNTNLRQRRLQIHIDQTR